MTQCLKHHEQLNQKWISQQSQARVSAQDLHHQDAPTTPPLHIWTTLVRKFLVFYFIFQNLVFDFVVFIKYVYNTLQLPLRRYGLFYPEMELNSRNSRFQYIFMIIYHSFGFSSMVLEGGLKTPKTPCVDLPLTLLYRPRESS